MKKQKILKFILLVLVFSAAIAGFAFAAGNPLELQYPTIQGRQLETTATPIGDYVAYIYTFIMTISGIIALGALIVAGIQYINSIGNPAKLQSAKKQILNAFWGTILLLSSSLILYLINPNILNFKILVEPFPAKNPDSSTTFPPQVFITDDLLLRLDALVEKIKSFPDTIKQTSSELKSLTDQCNCSNTQPTCACNGGGPGSVCEPKVCYGGAGFHPCKSADRIKQLQKDINGEKDIIIYFGNWVVAERDDLKLDIDNVISPEIEWYSKLISNIQAIMSQIQNETDIQNMQLSVDYLAENKQFIEEEKQIKESLVPKLEELAAAVYKMNTPAQDLGTLPSACLTNVKDKCQASCKTGGHYGCHDALDGCQADKCSGGNPCPVSEIQSRISQINQFSSEIAGICDQIISIIKSIEEVKIKQHPI